MSEAQTPSQTPDGVVRSLRWAALAEPLLMTMAMCAPHGSASQSIPIGSFSSEWSLLSRYRVALGG